MRTFEVLIIVALCLSLAARLHRRTRNPRIRALLAAAVALTVAMHVWFDGGRWQMIPAYVLAGWMFAAAAAGLRPAG